MKQNIFICGTWSFLSLHALPTLCNLQEEFEDTKVVIRIHQSKKDRQHNGQKKKDKSTNNDLQNTTQKKKKKQHAPH